MAEVLKFPQKWRDANNNDFSEQDWKWAEEKEAEVMARRGYKKVDN